MDHGASEYAQQRLVAMLFAIFSVLALVLAAAGLYSVVSYGVATRTNEFGIRMALGAKARDVVRIVVAATPVNVGAGLAAGLVFSMIFDKLAAKWVTESSRDPLILAAVTCLLVAVAGLACLLRRGGPLPWIRWRRCGTSSTGAAPVVAAEAGRRADKQSSERIYAPRAMAGLMAWCVKNRGAWNGWNRYPMPKMVSMYWSA